MGNLKIKLFFLFTIFAFSAKTQTSLYHHFPDSSAIWNFSSEYTAGGMATSIEYSIMISGDTIINSTTYHKLKVPFIHYIIGGADEICNCYKGAIRDDTVNKKVFFIPSDSIGEQLLYDFNMKVGDPVKGYIETYALTTQHPDTIKEIDSVLVGNSYRKRWKIDWLPEINFIEGIGSTFGLIGWSLGSESNCGNGICYDLLCFNQNSLSLYPDTSTNCKLITSVNYIENNNDQIKIFPNPSNGTFYIDLDQSINIKEIQITDMIGSIVKRLKTNNNKRIIIDNIPSGIYILNIIDKDNKTTTKKIISNP